MGFFFTNYQYYIIIKPSNGIRMGFKMFFIKTTIKIMSAIALLIAARYYLNTFSNTALCLVLILIILNTFFVYRFYFPDEKDGSFFALFPVRAAYAKDEENTVFYKFAWLETVHYRFHCGTRLYNTDSLWRYKY